MFYKNGSKKYSVITLDVKGYTCPMPLLKAKKNLKSIDSNVVLKVISSDPESKKDFIAYFERNLMAELLEIERIESNYIFYILKKDSNS